MKKVWCFILEGGSRGAMTVAIVVVGIASRKKVVDFTRVLLNLLLLYQKH